MGEAGYRPEDLNRLRSPEELDQLLTVTTPRAWIALLAAFVVIAAAAIWGFGGKVAQTVPAQCVLVRSGGVREIIFGIGGEITDIRPQPGDFIRRGEVVARVAQPRLVEEILQVQNQMAGLEDPAELHRLEGELRDLREQLAAQSTIVSPYYGRVVQVRHNRAEFVGQGSVLLTVELTGQDIKELEAVLYLPIAAGQTVYSGMAVQIEPASVRKQEYGFMSGRIVSVSEFPVTPEQMFRVIGNDELVATLSGNVAPIEARVDLLVDPDTTSGFKWSASNGPAVKLAPGTLCNAAIVVGERNPLSLLLSGK